MKLGEAKTMSVLMKKSSAEFPDLFVTQSRLLRIVFPKRNKKQFGKLFATILLMISEWLNRSLTSCIPKSRRAVKKIFTIDDFFAVRNGSAF